MNIFIESQGFSVSPAIERHTRRCISDALCRHQDDVKRVDVFLRDVSGTKGVRVVSALTSVSLRGLPDQVTDASGSDLYAVVRLAARKARRTTERSLRRRRRVNRQSVRGLSFDVAAPAAAT
jgi:ribosome-associated translation inhibitor RaiA